MVRKSAIVIGAGIVGIATARALALKGYAVQVYERNYKASGASVRNFGMVWPIGQPAGKQYERAIRSRNCWKEIGDRSKLWYDPVGSMHLAYNQTEWVMLQESFEIFRNEGREIALLNRHQVCAISGIAKEKNCLGGLYSREEIIVDPGEAIHYLPEYLQENLQIKFNWGTAVTHVSAGKISYGLHEAHADLIVICSGSDFRTLYPEEFEKYPLTKCKLQMMRLMEEGSARIGPALCGGLSLIHYPSFKAAASSASLKKYFEETMPEYLKWGIHVMVSQNHTGLLTIGDSHEYGLSPDPFDRQYINDLILKYLDQFTVLKNPRLVETWNGVYGKLTNQQTELFISPEPGVYIINGVGGNGMTMSFGITEELVAQI
ncbi:MAG TPA: TIGR03364 family FAD-dependent oxidoreductase [Puia sp.]